MAEALPKSVTVAKSEASQKDASFCYPFRSLSRRGKSLVVSATDEFAGAFAKARAVVDRHTSLIEQMVLAEFMPRGIFVAHIRRIRNLYYTRQTRLLGGLHELLGQDTPISVTETGTHVVLPLPETADDRMIARRLMTEASIVARPLSPYYAGRTRTQGLILGFAAFSDAEIDATIARLARIRDVIRSAVLPMDVITRLDE